MPDAAPSLSVGGVGGGGARRSSEAEVFGTRRGSARQRGYTAEWDRASRAYRAAHPLCLGCAAVGRTVVCEVVDHTVPHKGNSALFWDPANWQPACGWHHDVVKQQLERAYASGEIAGEDLALDSAAARALTLRLDP